jgi:hypothetical protein
MTSNQTPGEFATAARSGPADPPQAFIDEVQRAVVSRQPGMLRLLMRESASYPWHGRATMEIAAELEKLDIQPRWNHAILFTGHMIDAPTRQHPRFPSAAEPAARKAILRGLGALLAGCSAPAVGLAGAASGGDLLFHEGCAELGIESRVRLTLPPDAYIVASVGPAGKGWIDRFYALLDRLGTDAVEVLGESEQLPAWMGERPDYDVWQRTNLWLVEEGSACAFHRSLLALWDGKSGDGPGGTQHLVDAAPQLGVSTVNVIRTSSLIQSPAAG